MIAETPECGVAPLVHLRSYLSVEQYFMLPRKPVGGKLRDIAALSLCTRGVHAFEIIEAITTQ